jgi:mono/diheme cytochrome c family protein
MRKLGAILALLGAAAVLAPHIASADSVDPQDFKQIERGRYLAIAGDCAACHTVAGSGKDFAGGRTVPTPFGNLVSPNITPDPETGIGSWTDDEFVNALTKGTGRNGMLLYPAMPYTYMTKMSRDDVLAIRAYLRTVPAVHNEVESNQLSFPFNIRAGMAAWNAMFFHEGAFKPVEGKSDEWNRGAYLPYAQEFSRRGQDRQQAAGLCAARLVRAGHH